MGFPVKVPIETNPWRVRMAMESDLVDATPDDPGVEQVKYQTSFSVRIEGWQLDLREEDYPAFWSTIIRWNVAISPTDVETIYTQTDDLRDLCENPAILTRDGIPEARPVTQST